MAVFGLKLLGPAQLQRTLDKMSHRGDFTPMLKLASLYMIRSINQNFVSGGRPSRWKPSQRALAQSRSPGKPGMTLADTGFMRLSIGTTKSFASVKDGSKHGSSGVLRIQPRLMEIGLTCKYAAPMHFGFRNAQRGGRKVEGRPFLVYQPEDIAFIRKLFIDYIKSGRA